MQNDQLDLLVILAEKNCKIMSVGKDISSLTHLMWKLPLKLKDSNTWMKLQISVLSISMERLKIRSLMIMRILWKFPSVDMIVASRVPNLIKLEETTISADQDHNYLMEDEWKENIDEELSLAIKQHFM